MSTRTRIEEIRSQMKQADLEALRILERRARLAREIAELLRDDPDAYRDRAPVDLAYLEQAATEDLPPEGLRNIFRTIHSVMLGLEGPRNVAVVGDPGDIGQVVAERMFGTAVRTSMFSTAAEAFDEVSRGRLDCALVPYETSSEGLVLATILALRDTSLVVTSQCEVPAGLALLGLGADLASIHKVYVTDRDHARSASFLERDLPHATVIHVQTPRLACRLASEDREGAAIAHEHVGVQHGLETIVPDIGNERDLRIRFAVVGSRPAASTGDDMTSLVFTLQDEPGALLKVMDDFAKRRVNVRNILSRPLPGDSWEYLFYVDVQGHATDRPIVTALDEIKEHTKTLRVIGSYPARCEG